jgi:8-oxo-dGTP pyrophosphatase MutT (NUDIX family)
MKENKYVFCFIFDDFGRVLVLKRADFMRARPNEWDLPGGRVEAGESQEDGITREVFEETALKVRELELIARKDGYWMNEHHEFSYYRAYTDDAQVGLSEEHTEYQWHEPLVAATMVEYRPHALGFENAIRLMDKTIL